MLNAVIIAEPMITSAISVPFLMPPVLPLGPGGTELEPPGAHRGKCVFDLMKGGATTQHASDNTNAGTATVIYQPPNVREEGPVASLWDIHLSQKTQITDPPPPPQNRN